MTRLRILLPGYLFMAVIAGLLGTASAQALSPAPPPADVVFSNGGRILSMKVDGSQRKVLFGKDRIPKNDELGAVDPAVSPDQSTIAFGFRREVRGKTLTDIWTVGSDGTGARRLLISKPKMSYGDPTFDRNGVLVVAFFQTGAGFTRTGLVSVDSDGETRKVFDLRERRRPFRQPMTLAEPDFSLVGNKVLYVLVGGVEGDFADPGFGNTLMVRNLESGRTRELADDAYDGAWSRNGRMVAYSVQNKENDLEVCWWVSGCSFNSSLVVVGADGTGRRELAGPRLDARNPDWSYENRIVFQSTRNLPSVGEATEIYSIGPSGKCLTMLTNGSPASTSPVWAEGWFRTRSSTGCDSPPPDPIVEIESPVGTQSGKFWFGERFGTRLLSDSTAAPSVFLYQDCDRQSSSECRRPMLLINTDICRTQGRVASFASAFMRRQRGVPVFIDRGAEIGDFIIVWTGRSISYFSGASGKGKARGSFEVDGLRAVGSEIDSEDLPSPKIPASDLKLMEKVKSTYSKAGSVRATAQRLKMRPTRVRDNLKFSRVIGKFGQYERINCSR